MNQISSPVTRLRKLFLSIPSSIGSNSQHFSSLVSLNFSVNTWEIHRRWKFSSLVSRANDSRLSCERRREPLIVNKLSEKAPFRGTQGSGDQESQLGVARIAPHHGNLSGLLVRKSTIDRHFSNCTCHLRTALEAGYEFHQAPHLLDGEIG
jgi:hypothetical protein